MAKEKTEYACVEEIAQLAREKAMENASHRLLALKANTVRHKVSYDAALDEENEFMSNLSKCSDTSAVMELMAKPLRKPVC